MLLITDGLDTGEPEVLERELDWLRRHCAPRAVAQPAAALRRLCAARARRAVLHRHADAMLAVHNLETLDQLAASLAAVMDR